MTNIDDPLIDLTVDRKFRSPRRNWLFEVESDNEWQQRIPWLKNFNRVLTDERLQKVKRAYGDRLSDDYGCTVRRTSNGKWCLLGNSSEHTEHVMLVLEEFLYEERGGERGYPLTYCYSCGKTFFSRGNLECLECKLGTHSEIVKKLLQPKVKYKLTDNIRNGFGMWRGGH